MITFSLSELSEIINGKLHGNDLLLNNISIDSRNVKSNTLFIAIIGKRFDAHNFAVDAVNNGAKALLISRYLPISVPQIIVQDTSLALGALSSWVRKQVSARVVALTGSSGKTSVKEITASIFRECGKTLCNKNNLNNKLGVPITLSELTKEHKYVVIEIGASNLGEIDYMTKLISPENALVNNISLAHLEGFGSLSNIAKAKGEIFNNLPPKGIAIINADSNDWLNWKNHLNERTVWSFSLKNNNSNFFAYNIKINQTNTSFFMQTPYGIIQSFIKLTGKHNIYNALAAAALSLSVGIPLKAVNNGLSKFHALPGRLFPIYLSKHQIVLDDSYNANVASMEAAIEVLSLMPGYRVMVVADMAELGKDSKQLHRELGIYIRNKAIDLVISIGNLSFLVGKYSKKGEHFKNKNLLIKRLELLLLEHTKITILIKGSRSSAMEKVVEGLLQNKKYDCFSI
ncbi:UDP-N-acetylmuramoyl-tripeptide--D-alanyl-D-alanine ligase [Candidatus Pantoea edessiphila]|uniref:UDP-N-acetylmuramoyl-tripeptide--D-alanyl-D-alanine ligase n=1 Tax=Candidatus Pantoea edessiphila TaxID=2044610 RepID=A0A2P5T232_9GAMM|nr:UDP-N-acetylmuramoyl-tripeptide--D-alanyl-D-alanine ligase [Candidatus Pantoea edessiphila]PPI88649.1 UDP-N-acetylmuramoyl-tripeptide--D-alanyl-D-alanine ligase [Candidatus Pantoea edessiphila]